MINGVKSKTITASPNYHKTGNTYGSSSLDGELEIGTIFPDNVTGSVFQLPASKAANEIIKGDNYIKVEQAYNGPSGTVNAGNGDDHIYLYEWKEGD